ncbi:GntR family transcriptional regulator, partial [Streptococcus pyogenes]
ATRDQLLEQHRAINAALQARDPQAARGAVQHHLDFVEGSLADWRQMEKNEEIARQRYEHEQAR